MHEVALIMTGSRASRRLRRALAFTAVTALAVTAVSSPAVATTPAPPPGPGAVQSPDKALGSKWKSSSDVVVTGTGDADGYHLYIAREKDAFAWRTLATLTSHSIDIGPWGGSVCVTGSGRYAVAVFAPQEAVNKPALAAAGGIAAVVDTTTGVAHTVATGVQLAYFDPSCGPGDRALLTRETGDIDRHPRTDLLTVDAAAGKVVQTRHIAAQFTTPATAPDGDYGMVGGQLVKLAAGGGSYTGLGRPQGTAFGVRATADGAIDVVSVDGGQAVAQRYTKGHFATTATGPKDKVQLFGLRGGHDALVGQVTKRAGAPADLTTVPETRQVAGLSGDAHLVVEEALGSQTAQSVARPLAAASPDAAGSVRLQVRAVAGATEQAATVATTAAPTLDVDLDALSPVQTVTPEAGAAPAFGIDQPRCAVPRNDPTVQPLQPSPDMVEWAVDNAVHGTLTLTRPANYLKTGLPAYQPQGSDGWFKLDNPENSTLPAGSRAVPAQVMLGIVAQETNMSQASWHEVPGDTGNPLVASYYGSAANDIIDYSKSDCGYGISQVTTGMAVDDPGPYDTSDQQAIAVDYAANIAAGLNILIDKWNQLHEEPAGATDTMNDDNPNWIENWFTALWAYNSGLHTYADRNSSDSGGYYGLGWLNNPANPNYPANRDGFLRDSYADAETPSHWSYPERIMGWIETPQLKSAPGYNGPAYNEPAYGENSPTAARGPLHLPLPVLNLPTIWAFCDSAYGCSQSTGGCPAVDNSCWWHGHGVSEHGDCQDSQCAQENAPHDGGSEPGVQRTYERDCTPFDPSVITGRDTTRNWNMVYTLNEHEQYNLGCTPPEGMAGGKFLLRGGSPVGRTDTGPYAQVDLHQQGSGYFGHIWFTHGLGGSSTTGIKHRISGAWMPDLDLNPGQNSWYHIIAHLPSHGGNWSAAVYNVQRGNQAPINGQSVYAYVSSCAIDQDPSTGDFGRDHFIDIGTYQLEPGAQVILSNDNAPTTADVGYDAMAFVPVTKAPNSGTCGSVPH
jgi:hypothetical protein